MKIVHNEVYSNGKIIHSSNDVKNMNDFILNEPANFSLLEITQNNDNIVLTFDYGLKIILTIEK